jgi:transposase InsO family protein
MKKYGLSSGIREKKASRIEQRKRLEEHKKENLLKRRFRIARPDTHILTDVTYLHYGNNKLAYCSAIIDAVTGKPYDMTVRETNDLDLVLTSLSSLESVDIKDKAIFHSDQGALYLTDKFQNTIEIMGLQQSMSKRGNCWDNAPQESFFGHFKDECDYKNCKDIIELTAMIREYHDYFCNERRRWDHLKMTPVEYEKYLNDMPDEEFEEYLKTEKKK